MDHHCFWIGNCIGLFNVKFFLLFLCHLMLFLAYAMLLCGFSLVKAFRGTSTLSKRVLLGHSLAMITSAYSIGKVSQFAKDIFESFSANSTLVEACKKAHGRKQPLLATLNEVLGPLWSWLLPFRFALDVNFTEPAFPVDDSQRCHIGHCPHNEQPSEITFEDFLMEEASDDESLPGFRSVCMDEAELAFGSHDLTECIDNLAQDLKHGVLRKKELWRGKVMGIHLNVNPENLSESRNRTVFGAAVQRSVDALRREYQDLKDLKENILGPSIKTPVPEKQPNAASRPTRQKQVVVGTDGEEYTINDVLNLQSEAINLRGLVSRLQAMDVPVGPQVSREQYDALIGDIDGLKAVIAGLEAERDDLCSALQEAKFMNLKLDEKRREWQETEDKLLQRIEELKHEVDTRAEVVDSRASAASQLRSQLSELEKRYDALVFTVKELGEQKTSLIDGLREKQCQLELVISKLQIVEEQMGRKDAMLASYQKSISGASTMEKENQQLKKDLEEAKSNARRVKQDYDQLKLTQTTPMPSDRHAKPSMVLGPSPRERADITREQAVDIKLGPRTEEVIASEVKIRELEKDLASKEERLRELSAQQNTTHTALKDLTAAYTSLLQVHEKVLANVKVRMGTIDFNNLQLELDQVKKTAQLMGLDFEATLEKQAEAQGKVIQLSGELETHQSELAAANERNAQLQAELQLLQRGKDVMLDRMARKRDVVGAQPDDDEANEDLNPWIKGRVARRLVVGWFSSKHKTVECVVLFQPAHLGFVDFKGEFPVNPKPKPKNQIKYSDILAVNYGPQARATAIAEGFQRDHPQIRNPKPNKYQEHAIPTPWLCCTIQTKDRVEDFVLRDVPAAQSFVVGLGQRLPPGVCATRSRHEFLAKCGRMKLQHQATSEGTTVRHLILRALGAQIQADPTLRARRTAYRALNQLSERTRLTETTTDPEADSHSPKMKVKKDHSHSPKLKVKKDLSHSPKMKKASYSPKMKVKEPKMKVQVEHKEMPQKRLAVKKVQTSKKMVVERKQPPGKPKLVKPRPKQKEIASVTDL